MTVQWDGPALRGEPPPAGIAFPVAGVSCGALAGEHDRVILRAPSSHALDGAIRDWRCRCGRGAFGESTRRPAPALPVAHSDGDREE